MKYHQKPTGLKRIYLAGGHSLRALKWLLKNEAAFKQEFILSITLILFSLLFSFSFMDYIILWSALLFVMLIEILNTAIEAVVDRVGLEIHPLSGLAKDLGSLAVMVSIIIAVFTWLSIFFDI